MVELAGRAIGLWYDRDAHPKNDHVLEATVGGGAGSEIGVCSGRRSGRRGCSRRGAADSPLPDRTRGLRDSPFAGGDRRVPPHGRSHGSRRRFARHDLDRACRRRKRWPERRRRSVPGRRPRHAMRAARMCRRPHVCHRRRVRRHRSLRRRCAHRLRIVPVQRGRLRDAMRRGSGVPERKHVYRRVLPGPTQRRSGVRCRRRLRQWVLLARSDLLRQRVRRDVHGVRGGGYRDGRRKLRAGSRGIGSA